MHSTQHALFKLLQSCQKEIDNSGFIGTILIYLSKVYDGLPHDLINAKFEGYGLNRNSLKLIFLEGRKQRTKKGSSKEVPQGSIIGPLLINVIISDLYMIIRTKKSEILLMTTPFIMAEKNDRSY